MADKLKITFSDDLIITRTKETPLRVGTQEAVNVTIPTLQEHRLLQGLDYESSGHIGFASSKDLTLLVPRDLSILPTSDLSNRQAYIYLDNNGVAEKTTVSSLLDKKLRTVEEFPTDAQVGDFVFVINK